MMYNIIYIYIYVCVCMYIIIYVRVCMLYPCILYTSSYAYMGIFRCTCYVHSANKWQFLFLCSQLARRVSSRGRILSLSLTLDPRAFFFLFSPVSGRESSSPVTESALLEGGANPAFRAQQYDARTMHTLLEGSMPTRVCIREQPVLLSMHSMHTPSSSICMLLVEQYSSISNQSKSPA